VLKCRPPSCGAADATVAEINWDLYGAARIWRTRMTLSDSWRALARTLIGEPELTPLEVVQEAGVDIEQARRLWRALGFPRVPDEDRVFTQSDAAMLRGVHALIEQKIAAPEVVMSSRPPADPGRAGERLGGVVGRRSVRTHGELG